MEQNSDKDLIEMQDEAQAKKKELIAKIKKEVREWVVSLAIAVVLVVLIRSFLFTIIRVDGASMSDTLLNNDRLFVSVLSAKMDTIERFDVVICEYPNRDDQYVKRVIGMPGDTLKVQRGVLYINGEAYEEPYLSEARTIFFDRGSNNFEVTVPAGKYFVMGDNRDDSNDSRRVGMIDEDMMIGKVKFIIWPLDRIGGVSGSEEYNR